MYLLQRNSRGKMEAYNMKATTILEVRNIARLNWFVIKNKKKGKP